MADEKRYTEAADVVPPPPAQEEPETVGLPFLRDKDGEPVRVLVSPLSELVLLDILATLPGAVNPDELAEPVEPSIAGLWEQFRPYAAPLIERSCSPRFSWAEPAADGCLPGKWLRDAEQLALTLATLRVSGWMGSAAALAASFLGARRERAERAAGAALGDDAGVVGAVPGEAVSAERDARPAAPDGEGADASAGLRRDGAEGAEGGAAVPAGTDVEAGGIGGGGDEHVAA
jgi:hypothetical protein